MVPLDMQEDEEPETDSIAARNSIVAANLNLVHHTVRAMGWVFAGVMDEDDAFGFGCLGLIRAAERYDMNRGIAFSSFAVSFIRGAVIDAARKLDRVSRTQRRTLRRIEEARWELANQLGRWPTADELSRKTGVTSKELAALENASAPLLSVDGLSPFIGDDDETLVPESRVDKEATSQLLAQALRTLTSKEYLILKMYYEEGHSLRVIANHFLVSESRVSQIHRKTLDKLKKTLRDAA